MHLWLGLASGLIVFIVALTGSVLVFEHELEPLIESGFQTVSVPDDQKRVPIDQLVNAATQEFGNKKVSRIIVEPRPNRTVVVELNREIVRRPQLGATTVAAGDSIELVHFVGGG